MTAFPPETLHKGFKICPANAWLEIRDLFTCSCLIKFGSFIRGMIRLGIDGPSQSLPFLRAILSLQLHYMFRLTSTPSCPVPPKAACLQSDNRSLPCTLHFLLSQVQPPPPDIQEKLTIRYQDGLCVVAIVF